MRLLLILLIAGLTFSSCKQDKETATTDTTAPAKSTELTPETIEAQKVIAGIRSQIRETEDPEKRKSLLVSGLTKAEQHKLGSSASGFLLPLVKDYPNDPLAEQYLAKLSSALQDVGKSIPGDVLANAYVAKYPKGQYLTSILKKRKKEIRDMPAYLQGLAETIFVDPDKFGINKANTQTYVDACEAYALGFPEREDVPTFLYRAAEMARTLKTFPKAITIYEWISSKYPDYEKTPTTIFLKGFILENDIKDKAAAKKVYEEFLSKYPKSDLVDDVEFLLKNIDKSDEEIMQQIDANAKKKK